MRTQRRPVYTRDVLTGLKRGYSVVTRVASRALKFSGSLKATLFSAALSLSPPAARVPSTILTLRVSSSRILSSSSWRSSSFLSAGRLPRRETRVSSSCAREAKTRPRLSVAIKVSRSESFVRIVKRKEGARLTPAVCRNFVAIARLPYIIPN